MKLYTLSDVNITPGVPESLYPNTFKFVPGGLINEGGIGLELDRVLSEVPELKDMVKQRHAEAFAFGLPHIIPPDPAAEPVKSLLVSVDLVEWFPDPNMGDESTVVCWSGRRILLRCLPGKTSLLNLKHGSVLRNLDGTPKIVSKVARIKKLSEAREALERSESTSVFQLHS